MFRRGRLVPVDVGAVVGWGGWAVRRGAETVGLSFLWGKGWGFSVLVAIQYDERVRERKGKGGNRSSGGVEAMSRGVGRQSACAVWIFDLTCLLACSLAYLLACFHASMLTCSLARLAFIAWVSLPGDALPDAGARGC